ncbi:unnamed protein product [Phaeothamnion confervicola]
MLLEDHGVSSWLRIFRFFLCVAVAHAVDASPFPYKAEMFDAEDIGAAWKRMITNGNHTPIPRATVGGATVTWPLFLIIGVQKGGASELKFQLFQHPMVAGARSEIHFFDRSDMAVTPGRMLRKSDVTRLLVTYSELLLPPKPTRAERLRREREDGGYVIDASPKYMYQMRTPYRVQKLLPHVRAVVLLRDPVERYFSSLAMYVCRGFPRARFHTPGKLQEYLAAAAESYAPYKPACRGAGAEPERLRECEKKADLAEPLNRGLYADQLERWLYLFNASQIMVVDSAELFSDVAGVVGRVAEFGGLSRFEFTYDPEKHAPQERCSHTARSKYASLRSAIAASGEEKALRDFYRPHNERLFRLIGSDFGWNDAPRTIATARAAGADAGTGGVDAADAAAGARTWEGWAAEAEAEAAAAAVEAAEARLAGKKSTSLGSPRQRSSLGSQRSGQRRRGSRRRPGGDGGGDGGGGGGGGGDDVGEAIVGPPLAFWHKDWTAEGNFVSEDAYMNGGGA